MEIAAVTVDSSFLVLRAAGVAFILDLAGNLPRVVHWGADLGPLDDDAVSALRLTAVPSSSNYAIDEPRTFPVWPTEHDGWAGTPAISGHIGGGASTPRPRLRGSSRSVDANGASSIRLEVIDDITGLSADLTYTLDQAGVLVVDMSLTRGVDGLDGAPYVLDALRAMLPVPDRASELLDFTGGWAHERSAQRFAPGHGTHLRRGRRGKPGHDSPFLMALGTAGFGFRDGELWAVHLAWSGDTEYLAERLPEGAGAFSAALGASEALRGGEVLLHKGERYEAPRAMFVWSDAGLDGLADRLHRRLRSRARHPSSPRPLTLNTWEAVYFDHDIPRLRRLAQTAADVGVERLVLDDGWFHGRRHDGAGLGDWYVDAEIWPDGLWPLVDLVRERGMQFGLWVEPEMVSPDSDLAREHPEWLLSPREGLPISARRQYVLDLAHPEAYATVRDRLSVLIDEYKIDFVKWDHNRDLLEAVAHREGVDRPAVHAQTRALYRLLDELRLRYPALEIETCAGGGGRIDLGILDRAERLWASDTNDPVERVRIERWTRMLVPPEMIGSHLGTDRAHTTSRTTDLAFRLTTALTAHAGIEMDLSRATTSDLDAIRRWSAVYRELRGLIHSGRVVNADLSDASTRLTGIVGQDGARAVFTWTRLTSSPERDVGRIRWPGLDPGARYRVRTREEWGRPASTAVMDPPWVQDARDGGVDLPGAVLAVAGVPMPELSPQQSAVFDLRRII